MSSVGYATLQVIPSMKGIEGKLGQGLTGPMKTTGAKAGKTLGESTKASFGVSVKGIAAGLAGSFLVTKAVGFLKDSVAQAREAQKATAQTNAVIKSTGGAANVTAKGISNLANAISLKSGIDDEAIQSGSNLLLTFRNIRNEAGKGNDVFNQATHAITDLSVGMGQDMKSSAVQLGKALNDPIKGITALSRVGVTFDDQQKKQIKRLVTSGHQLEAQKIILKELTKEFGGSAAAQATAGDKMKVAWENLKEQVGTALLPTLDHLETFLTTKGIPTASKFVRQMQNGKGAGGEFADKLRSVFDAAKGIAGRIEAVIKALNGMPSWAKKLLAGGAVAGFAAKKLGITAILKPTLGKAVGGLIGSAKPVPVFVVNKGFGDVGGGGGGAAGKAGGFLTGGAASAAVAIAAYLGPPLAAALGAFALTHVPGQSQKDKTLNRQTQVGVEQGGAGSESGGGMGPPAGTGINDIKLWDTSKKPVVPIQLAPDFLKNLTAGTTAALSLQHALKDVPPKVVTKLLTPGAEGSVKQITALANKYRLTPKQVRTILKADDVATPKIKAVLKGLDTTDKKHTEPKIQADIKNAMAGVRQTLSALGVVGKAHPTPKITVDAAAALQALARVKYDLDHIQSKTVVVTTVRRGGSQQTAATGGLIRGPGTGTSDSIPAMLSNGEFVINAAATRRHLALLRSINAQRFAAGGQVGSSSSSGGPTVLHLYDIDGRLMGTMRAVARQEQDDTSSFDRSMAGRR